MMRRLEEMRRAKKQIDLFPAETLLKLACFIFHEMSCHIEMSVFRSKELAYSLSVLLSIIVHEFLTLASIYLFDFDRLAALFADLYSTCSLQAAVECLSLVLTLLVKQHTER